MKNVKRIGMVIGIIPEKLEFYKQLHSDKHPGVRDLLVKYHIRNFSIFIRKMDDGKEYLFAYYEYTGENYEEDMAKLDSEPRNIEWLKLCDPCQAPLKGEKTWAIMTEIFHNE